MSLAGSDDEAAEASRADRENLKLKVFAATLDRLRPREILKIARHRRREEVKEEDAQDGDEEHDGEEDEEELPLLLMEQFSELCNRELFADVVFLGTRSRAVAWCRTVRGVAWSILPVTCETRRVMCVVSVRM